MHHKPSGGRAPDFFSQRYGKTPEGRKMLHERYGYYADEGWNQDIISYIEHACGVHDAGHLPKLTVTYIDEVPPCPGIPGCPPSVSDTELSWP